MVSVLRRKNLSPFGLLFLLSPYSIYTLLQALLQEYDIHKLYRLQGNVHPLCAPGTLRSLLKEQGRESLGGLWRWPTVE